MRQLLSATASVFLMSSMTAISSRQGKASAYKSGASRGGFRGGGGVYHTVFHEILSEDMDEASRLDHVAGSTFEL